MAKKPQQPQQEKAKTSPSKGMSDSDKPKQAPRYFNRRLYIPKFGMVEAGDRLTKAALDAWKAKTKVPINAYIGEPLRETPMTDKEKAVEYEKLKED